MTYICCVILGLSSGVKTCEDHHRRKTKRAKQCREQQRLRNKEKHQVFTPRTSIICIYNRTPIPVQLRKYWMRKFRGTPKLDKAAGRVQFSVPRNFRIQAIPKLFHSRSHGFSSSRPFAPTGEEMREPENEIR